MEALSQPESANGREPGGLGEDLADRAAVGEGRHALVGVRGGDPGRRRAATRAAKTSAGSAFGITSQRSSVIMRTAIGSPSATRWRNMPPSQSPRNTSWRSGSTTIGSSRALASALAVSDGATELRDVDGVDALAGQSGAHLHGLLAPLGRQGGIAVAVDELERLALDRGLRLAVADEEQLGGPGRRGEAVLAEERGSGTSAERRGRPGSDASAWGRPGASATARRPPWD